MRTGPPTVFPVHELAEYEGERMMASMNAPAHRMVELVEPIGFTPYSADEPNEAMFALGFTNYWDTYFTGRAAP